MTLHSSEYFPIFVFLVIAFALSCIILGASYLLANSAEDSEKVSA
jgi:NADH:ubiquinone oxidoreductase subunit 3 (subunit A)